MPSRAQILVLISLAAALALGLYLLWFELPPSHRSPAPAESAPAACRADEGTSRPRPQSGPPGEAARLPQTVEDAVDAGEAALDVSIRIVDEQGRPVTGLSVGWRSPQGLSSPEVLAASTDEHGQFAARLKKPGRVLVTSRNERWRLIGDVRASWQEREFELRAMELCSVLLFVVGDAGEPYAGDCEILGGKLLAGDVFETQSELFSRNMRLDGFNSHKLAGVPCSLDLEFYFPACLVGHDAQKQYVQRSRLAEGQSLVIRLQGNPANDRGCIEFDLAGYEGELRDVQVVQAGSSAIWASGRPQEGAWRSRLIPPGEYVVKVIGNPGWESAPVSVKPRQVSRVSVKAYQASSVSLRVLDEAGNPLEGALLTRNTRTYPAFDGLQPGPDGVVSDALGAATLRGVPPGEIAFLVEAGGFEPQFLQLTIREGSTLDAGSVYLKPARGRILVRLKNMHEGRKYTILLLQPGGGSVRVVGGVNVRETVLDALPRRAYVLAVVAGAGGRAASAPAVISENAGALEVEIDVAGLKEEK